MTFKPSHIPGDLYFITGSIINWLPVFKHPTYRSIILGSLSWLRLNRRWKLFAYVVMPDHLHWISLPLGDHTIQSNIQDFSSFTAHSILRTARSLQHSDILKVMATAAKTGKKHRIWQMFQAKNIYTAKFLLQKMEYIHNNPVSSEWFTGIIRSDYYYSSASYYDAGSESAIPIDDVFNYMDLLT